MYTKRCSNHFLYLILGLALIVSGCNSPGFKGVDAFSEAKPQEVVGKFYGWYMAYSGNPLAEGAYRSCEYLTEDCIQNVDEILKSAERGGYDPFLCAQDIPNQFTLTDGPSSADRNTALVILHEVWNPGTQYETAKDARIRLQSVEGEWKIAKIDCDGSAYAKEVITARKNEAESPEDIVEEFYDGYLAYIGDPASSEMKSPVADRAYRSSEFLTDEFVRRIDDLITDNQEEYGYIPFDPFLCAQVVPRYVMAETSNVSGDEANVVVKTSCLNHRFTVDLQRNEGDREWKISGIDCDNPQSISPMPEGPIPMTPEGVVSGFYSWYLWYAKDVGNPLVDRVYHSSEYLSGGLIHAVDELLSSSDRGGYDPFICAQDIPESFTIGDVSNLGDVAQVVVNTSFAGHEFTVVLRFVDGRWEISEVLCK